MKQQVMNPMKYTCAPNHAGPDYIAVSDFRSFIAYGMMRCWLSNNADDPNEDCNLGRPITREDVDELRGYFLDAVQAAVMAHWLKLHVPGDGWLDADFQPLLVSDNEETVDCILQWAVRMDKDAMMFCLDISGSDEQVLWLSYDALKDRKEVLRVLAEAVPLTSDGHVWYELVKKVYGKMQIDEGGGDISYVPLNQVDLSDCMLLPKLATGEVVCDSDVISELIHNHPKPDDKDHDEVFGDICSQSTEMFVDLVNCLLEHGEFSAEARFELLEPQLRDEYPNGKCPDCGEPILEDAEEGDECENCGHVFNHARPADDHLEFDRHTADGGPEPAVVMIFNTEADGSQCDQICLVPFYPHVFGFGDEAYRKARDYAEKLADFVVNALNAYVKTADGKAHYEALKVSMSTNRTPADDEDVDVVQYELTVVDLDKEPEERIVELVGERVAQARAVQLAGIHRLVVTACEVDGDHGFRAFPDGSIIGDAEDKS